MNETLYGPWRIRSGRVDAIPGHAFSIEGSDGTDGRFLASPSLPVDMLVRGAKWSVILEQRQIQTGEWKAQTIHRTTAFDSAVGRLTTRLDSHHPPKAGVQILIYYPGIELICVSQDPNMEVTPPEDPLDFRVPKG